MYSFVKTTEVCRMFLLLLLHQTCVCIDEPIMCDRRPLGSNTDPLSADNRFAIEIVGLDNQKYIPNNNYPIRLYSRDNQSTFIAFTIYARGATANNTKNPLKPIDLDPGRITSSLNYAISDTVTKSNCPNTVFQADITPKTSVEALWIAPRKDQKCVTIHAYVAIKTDVWYNSDGPLSTVVCEDQRKMEDMPPKENPKCQVCTDARYELRFQGKWSYNTHPKMFPKSRDLAKFSDVVGASHSKHFSLYKANSVASDGLRMLAQQGNTTGLELEILIQLGKDVRTIIKATGPPKPNMTTITSFRVTREHHYISLVSAILPSPDWFLGVANLELCHADTNEWNSNVVLNLYPMDAGTDNGWSFESPNDPSSPPQPITSVITRDISKEEIKPFVRLEVVLVRTYFTPLCETEDGGMDTSSTDNNGDDYGQSRYNNVNRNVPTSSETPLPTDSTVDDCSITTWEEWLPCEGECIDKKLTGYKTRFRYYIVDGVAIGKNFENDAESEDKEVSQFCLNHYPTNELQKCVEDCEDPQEAEPEDGIAQRRTFNTPIKPGEIWGRK